MIVIFLFVVRSSLDVADAIPTYEKFGIYSTDTNFSYNFFSLYNLILLIFSLMNN